MEADYLIDFSYSMVIATGCLTALILIEWWLIVKFQNDEVSKQAVDCFMFMRRTLSLIVFILWSMGCYLIFNFDGKLISALVNRGCTNDVILAATFKSMVAYLDSTHN